MNVYQRIKQICCHKVEKMNMGNIEGVDFLNFAENLGALKTFQKPFKQVDLLAAVGELLG